MNRVVITGMGAVSPYGEGCQALFRGLEQGLCAVRPLPPQELGGVNCRVAALVPPLDARRIPRELRRTMSPMSVQAFFAAAEAVTMAGLAGPDGSLCLPQAGVAMGSTLGSPQELSTFFDALLREHSLESMRSTVFFKVMSHTVAANLALAFGCRGRTLAPAAACASGLMAIGLAFEAIASGRESLMLCGGADEFHPLTAGTFERLGAASLCGEPLLASLPFDERRSGVVCGEGAGVLVLESLESALARQAPILAEVRGFASVSSPANMAHPDAEAIAHCMQRALDDAGLGPYDLACVNAHATGTLSGDMAEGQAIARVCGNATPVNGLKGHLGHTMAASGALESIACIQMLGCGCFVPTLGLEQPDRNCGGLNHIRRQEKLKGRAVLKNSFALGGCNCSLVFDTYYP